MKDRNGKSGDRFAHLDLSSLSFPSDSLSIGAIRKLNPRTFDIGVAADASAQPRFFLMPEERGNSIDYLGDMLYYERMIAAYAFALGSGIEPPDVEIDGFKAELANKYIQCGLAQGRHHAEEMIRELERHAKNLVRDKPK